MSMGGFPESLSQAMLVGIMLVGRLGVLRSRSFKAEPHLCVLVGQILDNNPPREFSSEDLTVENLGMTTGHILKGAVVWLWDRSLALNFCELDKQEGTVQTSFKLRAHPRFAFSSSYIQASMSQRTEHTTHSNRVETQRLHRLPAVEVVRRATSKPSKMPWWIS